MPNDLQPYLLPLVVALVVFVAFWPLSVRRDDVSIVDLFWGPGFLLQLVVAGWVVGISGARDWLLLGLIGLWAIRLGFVIARRTWVHEGEDPRYAIIRRAWGTAFWWKSLFIVFVLQAAIQWLIALGPISGLVLGSGSIGLLGWGGVAVALIGLAFEASADAQLDAFKRTAAPGALCTTGLRAHVRHPNYLGEVIFWIGIGLLVFDGGVWMGLVSPLLIGFFLTYVSGVPILDEHLASSRQEYAAYRRRVPAILPRILG